jgi:hypothetical protein
MRRFSSSEDISVTLSLRTAAHVQFHYLCANTGHAAGRKAGTQPRVAASCMTILRSVQHTMTTEHCMSVDAGMCCGCISSNIALLTLVKTKAGCAVALPKELRFAAPPALPENQAPLPPEAQARHDSLSARMSQQLRSF